MKRHLNQNIFTYFTVSNARGFLHLPLAQSSNDLNQSVLNSVYFVCWVCKCRHYFERPLSGRGPISCNRKYDYGVTQFTWTNHGAVRGARWTGFRARIMSWCCTRRQDGQSSLPEVGGCSFQNLIQAHICYMLLLKKTSLSVTISLYVWRD